MTALTADLQRVHTVHQPQFLPLPVKAGARIYLNALTCTDARADSAGAWPNVAAA